MTNETRSHRPAGRSGTRPRSSGSSSRVGPRPRGGPGRDLAAGAREAGRPAPAVAVLVLRLEARALRRDVRPGLRAAPRRGRVGRARRATSGTRSGRWRAPSPSSRGGPGPGAAAVPADAARLRTVRRVVRTGQPVPRRSPSPAGRGRAHPCRGPRPLHRARRGTRQPADGERSGRDPLDGSRGRGDGHVLRTRRREREERHDDDHHVDVATITPIDHDEAMQITEVEFGRMRRPRRELGAGRLDRADGEHRLGRARGDAAPARGGRGERSFRENAHQMRAGKRLFKEIGGDHWVDGVNEIQIRERAQLTNEEVIDRFAAVAPRAVRARRRIPKVVRALPLVDFPEPHRPPVARLPDGHGLHARRVDAPRRHRTGDRTGPRSDGRARRPDRRGHRRRMGGAPRPGVLARAHRARRRARSPPGVAARRWRSTRSSSSACSRVAGAAPASSHYPLPL